MRLQSFRITNFRSIQDSGDIDASRITALLGRNESGKSNLLRGLYSLNPLDGFKDLNPIKDFPRDRRLEECKDDTPVVSSLWTLDGNDRNELLEVFPSATEIDKILVERTYKGQAPIVSFPDMRGPNLNVSDIKNKVKKIAAGVRAKGSDQNTLEAEADKFEEKASVIEYRSTWATEFTVLSKHIRTQLAGADVELTETQEGHLSDLEELGESILNYNASLKNGKDWVRRNLPKFFYLDDYPELDGRQDIAAYMNRKQQGHATSADLNFEKLCKVAGLNPGNLQSILNDAEQRNQLANRASAVITREVKRLWKDRELKIRFNLDGNHFDTFISDPTATYDVEVNLNDRSRGFQWFFAFYVSFAADTNGGTVDNAILLLDEPGLYLHAKSQGDLLRHFEDDFENQILYSTHSPFMVPTHNLDAIRTVNIADKIGTTVTNSPTGDERTLFPIQAALGYDLAQSLFVGPSNLIVEGVTDFWILSSVSAYLTDTGRSGLNHNLTLTPAGGAQKISYMVALLTSEALNVLVLFDKEKASEDTKDDLLKAKLIRDYNVIFVSDGLDPMPKEADIEDLLDPTVFDTLVRESYAKELKAKKLILNQNIPRIAKRYEAALKDLGLEFHKTRPARLFLTKMATDPASVLTEDSSAKFSSLFELINERYEKNIAKGKATS